MLSVVFAKVRELVYSLISLFMAPRDCSNAVITAKSVGLAVNCFTNNVFALISDKNVTFANFLSRG